MDFTKDRFVRIGQQLFPYEDKAPFVVSGVSIAGAIEVDAAADVVKCHECGGWFAGLSGHVRIHGLTSREYRAAHQINSSTSLSNMATTERRRQINNSRGPEFMKFLMSHRRKGNNYGKIGPVQRTEYHNLKGVCFEQLLDKIRRLAEQLGRSPSCRDMKAHGISIAAINKRFGSAENAFVLAGVSSPSHAKTLRRYTDAELLLDLARFVINYGRNPGEKDFRLGVLANRCTYLNHFGSFRRALELADIPNRQPLHAGYLSDGELLQRILDFSATHGRLPEYKDFKMGLMSPSIRCYQGRFGSLLAAQRRARQLAPDSNLALSQQMSVGV